MTGNLFWCRKIELKIGSNTPPNNAILISTNADHCDFRISFRCTKTRDRTKNTGTISVYNLSKEERDVIDRDYDRVSLVLGYHGNTPYNATAGFWSTIVDGWVHQVTHERRGSDIVTDITYLEAAPDVNRARINKVFDGGTRYRTVIEDIVNVTMPTVVIGDISGIPEDSIIPRGRAKTLSEQSFKAISEIARNHDARATVDNNVLQIISNDSFSENQSEVPLFNDCSGLIRASKTEKGANISCYIHPSVRPNDLIVVEDEFLNSGKKRKSSSDKIVEEASSKTKKESLSETINNNFRKRSEGTGGIFRVNKVVFSGDNRGNGSFKMNIDGQRTDGYKVIRDTLTYSPVAHVIPTQPLAETK